MGIVHFAPVGASPGAATSALAYIKRHEDKLKGSYEGDIIESAILFCSHEVNRCQRPADDYAWNDYGRSNEKQGWQRPPGKQNVIEVVRDFLEGEGFLGRKSLLYAWPVDVNHYDSCFAAVATATLAVARSDATGKYVWANLTGGTNVLNAALMQVALLSGLINRTYYTFVAHEVNRRYLQPFSSDPSQFCFVQLPLIKTTFDLGYYRVLELLENGAWQWGKDLLSQLKNDESQTVQTMFRAMDWGHFKDQFLNRMAGDVLEEQKGEAGEQDRPVRISQRGREVLEYIHLNELVEALIHRESRDSDLVQKCRKELAKHRC